MIIKSNAKPEATPAGKRCVKRNVWGNLVGYVSGKRFCVFGEAYDPCAEADAEAWLNS